METFTAPEVIDTEVSYSALFQAAQELLQTEPSDNECITMRELVTYLKKDATVRVSLLAGSLAFSFHQNAGRNKSGAFNRLTAVEESLGYVISNERPFNVIHLSSTPSKETITSNNNNQAQNVTPSSANATPLPNAEDLLHVLKAMQEATASANKAAAEATSIAGQFSEAMKAAKEFSERSTATIEQVRKDAAASLEALKKEAADALKAEQEKTAASAKAAAESASHCENMAKAMAAARQAMANDAVPETAWYSGTSAKVVGGVAVAGAVAGIGYLAWQHFTGAPSTLQ